MKSGTGPRIMTTVAVLTMVVSAVGFIFMLFGNAFFFDEYDKYGEVPIPGSSSLELPAGDVTVTFHTVLVGGSGNGLPVPPLKYRITGPGGVDAQLTEDYGSTTTVNNDARVRIGYLHMQAAGTYDIALDGTVSAYLNPRLAFGHGSIYGNVPWILAAVFGFAIVDLIIARVWAKRVRRSTPPGPGFAGPPIAGYGAAPMWSAGDHSAPPMPRLMSVPPPDPFTPSDEGIRVQSLKTLARLRDSGALTQDEYEAEKRRVLDGP